MKKVLQFSGIICVLLALVAFVLMMATPAMTAKGLFSDGTIAGTVAIFGDDSGLLSIKPSVLALIGWILLLVGILVALFGVVLPFLKVKGIAKFAGLLNVVAVFCFVLAGVFMFLVVPTFASANEVRADYLSIRPGWVIGGILAIAAGVFAILPAAADFLAKKK